MYVSLITLWLSCLFHWQSPPHLVSFDRNLKNVYCIEKSVQERNTSACVIFFTGGSSIMSPIIYEDFLTSVTERNVAVCVPSFRYQNLDFLIKRLSEEYREVVIAGHSSGCTVALNNCHHKQVKKVVLMDPVNTRITNTTTQFNIRNIKSVLFMNAMKSYKVTFDPLGLPFIPFLRITPELLDTRNLCKIKHIDNSDYGHCDILNPVWSNLMHFTRIAVGNRVRSNAMFQSYHDWISDTWCDFIDS